MKRLVVLILLLVIAATPALAGSDGLTLTMVDVGAAECIVVMVDGETMIVDAGYAKSWESIDRAVQDTGIDSISYFVITHPHADHIGSADKIIENYEVETVFLPPITYESAAYGHLRKCLSVAGYPLNTHMLGINTCLAMHRSQYMGLIRWHTPIPTIGL